jgi:hypothetical protein
MTSSFDQLARIVTTGHGEDVRVTQVVDAPIELVLSSGCIMRVHRGYDEETLLRLVALFGRR